MKRLLVCIGTMAMSYFSIAQTIGSKVSFPGTDGKTYTGVIKEISGDKYKVKYEGYDFDAWMVKQQFTIIDNGNANAAIGTNTNWHVGDKAEVYDMYTNKWENVTITIAYADRTPMQWRVTVDDKAGHTLTDFPVNASQLRSRNAAATAPAYAINSRVDAYYSDGAPKGRATIIEIKAGGRYKVSYDGCKAYWDEEVDWSQLKPASVVSASHPDIKAVMGKWAMFVYSYPNTVIKGNDIYRQYGTGAKAPPLQINADGTYIWYDEFNKPPVKGKWSTHAKIDGLKMGTEAVNGIILKDSRGYFWKVYKDRTDHIEARLMCSGETQGGSKI